MSASWGWQSAVIALKRLACASCICTWVTGCVSGWSYYRVDPPEARYFRFECRGTSGAPELSYFPYHGIYLSVDVERQLQIGLHIPSGVTVQLLTGSIRVTGNISSGTFDQVIPLRAFRHGALGNGAPEQFELLGDPYESPDNLGPLEGVSQQGYLVWYQYLGVNPSNPSRLMVLPSDLSNASIEIPAMQINGVRYEPLVLQIKRHHGVGLQAINC